MWYAARRIKMAKGRFLTMITTINSYLSHTFLANKNDNIQTWRCVDLDLNIPYFLIEYDLTERDVSLRMRKLVCSISDLSNWWEMIQQDSSAQGIRASLMSPGWLNSSDGWQIHELIGILTVETEPNVPWSTIYVLKNGDRFIDSNSEFDLKKDAQVKTLFKH